MPRHLARVQGTIHGFVVLNALKDAVAAGTVIAMTTSRLQEGFLGCT